MKKVRVRKKIKARRVRWTHKFDKTQEDISYTLVDVENMIISNPNRSARTMLKEILTFYKNRSYKGKKIKIDCNYLNWKLKSDEIVVI